MKIKQWLFVVAAAGLAVGCAGTFKKDPNQAQLASGCQIIKCTCEKVSDTILPRFSKPEPQDVLWRADGTAYCPDGYALQRQGTRSVYDRPLY